MGRPREHGPETRAALLVTAGRLLATEGPVGLSLRRVAAESETTTRAVYSLFGDKEGLLRALFREMAETMRQHHEAVPTDADPVREIVGLAGAYRAAARAQPNLYDLYLGRAAQGLQLNDDDIALAFSSFARVLGTIRRCVDSGRFPGRTPEAVGLQLWSLVHGLASLELRGFLGDESQAAARWRDAVSAALVGYQQRA